MMAGTLPPGPPSPSPSPSLSAFIASLPKAELHLHLEGALEPSDVFAIADENERRHLIRHSTVEAAHAARIFDDLGGFLAELSAACAVLVKEEDFYRVTRAYLDRVAAPPHNVRYCEVQVGPQEHVGRGVPLLTIFRGVARAMDDAERERGIIGRVVLTLIKDRDQAECEQVLRDVLALGDPRSLRIVAVGLAGPELGIPHAKFAGLFAEAKRAGLALITHAGEEGGPEYVADALDALDVQRVDHGVQSIHDPAVARRLAETGVGLCVCPLSNEKLQVYRRFFGGQNPLRKIIEAGIRVCLSSDDPAFFQGYVAENYEAAASACALTHLELWGLARSSFEMALGLPEEAKQRFLVELEAVKPREGDGV